MSGGAALGVSCRGAGSETGSDGPGERELGSPELGNQGPGGPDNDVCPNIGEALAEVVVAMIRKLPRDMSLTSSSVLSRLERNGPARLGDLALAEGITQPSMSALIAHLVKVGYAVRNVDPSDRRGVIVEITSEGLSYRAKRRLTLSAAIGEAVGALTEEELSSLLAAVPGLKMIAGKLADSAGRP